MAQMSGGGQMEPALLCPEYVLVADKVVYVISGKSSEQLIPLAEVTRFRLQKNEMLNRIDDASKESHFHIKAMVLRPEWDRNQMLEEAEASAMITRHLDPATMREHYGQRNQGGFEIGAGSYLRGFPTRWAVANIFATVSRSLGCTFPAGMRR